MRKKGIKNKGESLIESLISMFLAVTVLLPVSDVFLKIFKVSVKVDTQNHVNIENRNMAEILKTKKYNEIAAFTGRHTVTNLSDFYNKFAIEEKYRVLNKEFPDGSFREIEIKRTEDYYIDENGNKDYIFEMTVGNIKDYCFPDMK